MNFILNKSQPIAQQIYELICISIVNQEFKVNDKIFSVRELALKMGVNPNTIQKSFEMLENQGIIYSIKGSDWYVSENISIANEVVDALRKKKTDMYFLEMAQLGYDKDTVLKNLNERIGDDNE